MENRDKIAILSAGGRILQCSEDKDGGEINGESIYGFLPDDIKGYVSFQKWSTQPVSNYTLRMCGELIEMAKAFVHNDGARGVIITCGIQAIAELSYFADIVWNLNPPLIFTGSIFSADSLNSETSLRLTQSVRAVLSGSCTGKGALICIQDSVYSPADVLRISNFNRSGLLAFPESPLGVFSQPSGNYLPLRFPRHRYTQEIIKPLARNIPVITASLGDGDVILRSLLDKRYEELDGLIISGLGDGDVPSLWIPLLRKLLRSEIPVVLTSRYPDGIVQATESFEGSASQLLDMGLISGGMLSPYQARIRLAVGLAAGLTGQNLSGWMLGKV